MSGPDDLWNWDLDITDTEDYDSCAALSLIVLAVTDRPLGPSPHAIMFFHKGRYVGPPERLDYYPRIDRLDDATIRLIYMHKPTENSLTSRTSIFTWDPGRGKVVRSDKGPSGPVRGSASPSPKAPVSSAHPAAGGSRPASSAPVASVSSYGYGLIQSPSGNITCQLKPGADSGCDVTSFRDRRPYGTNEMGDPKSWVDLSGASQPTIRVKSDAPEYMASPGPQVVPYGQIVHVGDLVCASERDGMTCWNTETGHGAFIDRDGYSAF